MIVVVIWLVDDEGEEAADDMLLMASGFRRLLQFMLGIIGFLELFKLSYSASDSIIGYVKAKCGSRRVLLGFFFSFLRFVNLEY